MGRGGRRAQAPLASLDSDLEAFSHNPAHGSFGPTFPRLLSFFMLKSETGQLVIESDIVGFWRKGEGKRNSESVKPLRWCIEEILYAHLINCKKELPEA